MKKLNAVITQFILQQQIARASKFAKIVFMIKTRTQYVLILPLFWEKSLEYLELDFQLPTFVKRCLSTENVSLHAKHHVQVKRNARLSTENNVIALLQKRLWIAQAYIGLGISVCAVILSFLFVIWSITSAVIASQIIFTFIFGCLALRACYYFRDAKNRLLKIKPDTSEFRYFIKNEYSTASVYLTISIASIGFVLWYWS